MKTPPATDEMKVPLERVARFIRQLTHDVRNGLSAVDLEAAYILEIASDEEVLQEVHKLRSIVLDTTKMLRDVSLYFQPVTVFRIEWAAVLLMDELRRQVVAEFAEEAKNIEITHRFATETLEIDLNQTVSAILAILRNAFQFRDNGAGVRVSGLMEGGRAVIEVCEPKASLGSAPPPEQWGREPLYSTRSGGYGLGLYRARQIVEAQGGQWEASYKGGELVMRISFEQEPKPKG